MKRNPLAVPRVQRPSTLNWLLMLVMGTYLSLTAAFVVWVLCG